MSAHSGHRGWTAHLCCEGDRPPAHIQKCFRPAAAGAATLSPASAAGFRRGAPGPGVRRHTGAPRCAMASIRALPFRQGKRRKSALL